MKSRKSLYGQRFGKLVVLERSLRKSDGIGYTANWICQCDCGNKVSFHSYRLRNGRHTCCGCEKPPAPRPKPLRQTGHSKRAIQRLKDKHVYPWLMRNKDKTWKFE